MPNDIRKQYGAINETLNEFVSNWLLNVNDAELANQYSLSSGRDVCRIEAILAIVDIVYNVVLLLFRTSYKLKVLFWYNKKYIKKNGFTI